MSETGVSSTTLGVARQVITVAACLCLLLLGVAATTDAWHKSRELAHDRSAVYAPLSRYERLTFVLRENRLPTAFERFRQVLRPGDRFALVIDPATSRDTAGMYRLVALYYLLPAIAVADASRADAVLVFGEVPDRIRRSFWQVEELPGSAWIGRRR
jgi:hypothetical protein